MKKCIAFACLATFLSPVLAAGIEPPAQRTAALAELGRHFYFDKRLSGDMSTACASCHKPVSGWADGSALAGSYGGAQYGANVPAPLRYFRNTPSLAQVAHQRQFGLDGRFERLEQAIDFMLSSPWFMHGDAGLLAERVRQVPYYAASWEQAIGPGLAISQAGIAAALAAFIRALPVPPSPVQRYLAGESGALSATEKRGLAVFRGKGQCVACHAGLLQPDGGFHRLGVPVHPDLARDARPAMALMHSLPGLGVDDAAGPIVDPGRYGVTQRDGDRAKFRTPALGGLKYSAPYMHNGALPTLEAVVEFYNRGGGPGGELHPLQLDQAEKTALLAFLRAMSGDPLQVAIPAEAPFGLVTLPALPVPANTGPVPFRALPAPANAGLAPLQALSAPASAAPVAGHAVAPLAPLPPVPVPANNPMTVAKIALGKQLFWDGRLSGNGQMACVACHLPALGGSDGQAIARAYPGTRNWRNTLSTMNAAYLGTLFWDGRARSLEEQAEQAATSPIEGHGDPALMEMRLRAVPAYRQQFKAVFGTDLPHMAQAWQAIAAYERTLVSDSAKVPFDRYLRGDAQAISAGAKRGLALFVGKARCIACHSGPLLTDQQFHALGVPPHAGFRTDPIMQVSVRWKQGATEPGRTAGDDLGRYNISRKPADMGSFRTPTLRELKTSAPYMHNGAFGTLLEVVQFFNREKPDRLGLSSAEEHDLVALLEALSMDQPRIDADPKLPPARD